MPLLLSACTREPRPVNTSRPSRSRQPRGRRASLYHCAFNRRQHATLPRAAALHSYAPSAGLTASARRYMSSPESGSYVSGTPLKAPAAGAAAAAVGGEVASGNRFARRALPMVPPTESRTACLNARTAMSVY